MSYHCPALSGVDSVMSQVHWGYGAYMLLSMSPPGVAAGVTSLGDAPRQLQQLLANQEASYPPTVDPDWRGAT